MALSARMIGKKYGMTAEETNRVLLKLGYLDGVPGNYNLTELGLKYGKKVYHHSGPGGYSRYNMDWDTCSFDETIMDELIISPELINVVRDELKQKRIEKAALRAAEKAKAHQDYLNHLEVNNNKEAISEHGILRSDYLYRLIKKAEKPILITGIGTIIVYGGYKVIYSIKNHLSDKNDINKKTKYTINYTITYEGVRFNSGDTISIIKKRKNDVWIIKNDYKKHAYPMSTRVLAMISDYVDESINKEAENESETL